MTAPRGLMHIHGTEALRRLAPKLGTPWGLLRAAGGIGAVAALTSLFFLSADRWFSEWMPDGEIVVLALGFLILSRFFSQRKRYQQKYETSAYQVAFARFAIPGLGIIAASIAHLAYIAGPDIPPLWWRPWLNGLGTLLVVVGMVLWLRTVTTFGLDSLLMLYVYHPQEGSQLSTGMYDLLRHPVYAAAMDIAFGLALIHANWYALLVAIIMPLFFAGWIRLVEEPELMERFPAYADYRKRVPAFGPRIGNLWRFTRFLLAGRP